MKRALPLLLLLACIEHREVGVNFGETGEGLDGFLCKDAAGRLVLDRLGDGGVADGGPPALGVASLVTDFIDLGGLPGCRTGQLVKWCSEHRCMAISSTRICTPMQLPTNVTGSDREALRARVREQLVALKGQQVISDAPGQAVILRVLATGESCEAIAAASAFDTKKLVGCAYSCPTLFDKADQDVYLGFETLTGSCEQGLRICADGTLTWKP
ncbi:MAG: hypothetical protein IPJ65_43075 [Archangiaceae bacterium]|nr:hypothetical protein [Archangiaceae bacterium]